MCALHLDNISVNSYSWMNFRLTLQKSCVGYDDDDQLHAKMMPQLDGQYMAYT
jgi:hypothetical protein